MTKKSQKVMNLIILDLVQVLRKMILAHEMQYFDEIPFTANIGGLVTLIF